MTGTYPSAVLRLTPEAISTVRAAIDESLAELSAQLLRLRHNAVISEPWMGDATSIAVRDDYQRRVIDAADGPLAAVRAYEVELTRILDSLTAMEEQYLATEAEIARGLGRQA